MPWNPSDATQHTKKANTPKKKRQWAKVANSALTTYHGNEGKAIAAANAAVTDAFWLDGVFVVDAFLAEYPLLDRAFDPERKELADALCPSCNGRKKVGGETCHLCGGQGSVSNGIASVFQASDAKKPHDEDDPDDEDDDDDDDDDDDEDEETTDAALCDYRQPFQDAIYDRDFSQAQRKSAVETGAAMPGGGFPIKNTGDLKNAIHAIGRAKNRAATIRHIKKRARALGASNMIPEGWGDSEVADAEDMFIDDRIDPSLQMLSTPLIAIDTNGATAEVHDGIIADGRTSLRMYDSIELDDAAKVKVTQDGYLSAMPRIARTGIQLYRGRECGLRDGPLCDQIVRVYRPPESVFAGDAWHTYTHLPVTLDHPPVAVDSTNWKKYSVGETADEVLRDGQAVRVPMMLRDSAAVQAFKDGKNQLSVGYDCDIEWSPGMTDEGEPYDAIQRNIRANHLAVVAAARGGPTLKIGDHNGEGDHAMTLRTVTVDGLSIQMTDQAAEVVQRALRSLQDDIAALKKWQKAKKEEDDDRDDADQKKDQALVAKDQQIKTKDKAIETKDGEIVTLKKQLADAKAELEPAKLDQRVKDRLVIVQKAKGILGDKITCDGKTDAEIRKAVVVSRIGDAAKDWSDDKIAGAFDTLSVTRPNEFSRSTHNEQRDSIDQAVLAFGGVRGPVNSGRPGAGYGQFHDARDAAYADYENDVTNAWRGDSNRDQQRH